MITYDLKDDEEGASIFERLVLSPDYQEEDRCRV